MKGWIKGSLPQTMFLSQVKKKFLEFLLKKAICFCHAIFLELHLQCRSIVGKVYTDIACIPQISLAPIPCAPHPHLLCHLVCHSQGSFRTGISYSAHQLIIAKCFRNPSRVLCIAFFRAARGESFTGEGHVESWSPFTFALRSCVQTCSVCPAQVHNQSTKNQCAWFLVKVCLIFPFWY